MRIDSKGRVTIPVHVRRRLGLLPHTEVVLEVDGDSARIRKVDSPGESRGARLVRHLRGRGTVAMTTDEILALTRGEG